MPNFAPARPADLAAAAILSRPDLVHLRCHHVGDPTVGEAPGAGERGVRAPTAPDRRPAGLPRRRLHRHAVEGLIEAPLVRHRLAAPQLAQERNGLPKPRAALLERHPARLVLPCELAAHADAEDETPLGQVIEGRHLLGHRHRMAQRQEIDRRAEHQPPADDGGLRQLQQGIEDRHRKRDVVAAPERVVAGAIDQLDQLAQLADARQPGPGRGLGAAMDGDEADPQLVFEQQVHGPTAFQVPSRSSRRLPGP